MNLDRIRTTLARIPPAVTAIAVATVVVVTAGASRSCTRGAEVVVDEGGRLIRTDARAERARSGVREFPDTPDLRLAERVTEAEGLALGLALVAAETAIRRRALPADTASLASGLTLLPPGVGRDTSRPGVFVSRTSELAVRYRHEPLAIEVVSAGRSGVDRDGEMVLVCIRGDEPELYVALRSDASAPRPFAGEGELEAAGFKRESIRRSTATDAEWLDEVRAEETTP